MFGKLYLGELKKLLRPKGLIVIGIIFVVFFIIYAIFYNTLFDVAVDLLDNFYQPEVDEEEEPSIEEYIAMEGYFNIDFISYANPDNIDDIIAEITERRAEYAELNKQKGTKGDFGSAVYYCDSALAMLKYMKKNNVYGELNVKGYSKSLLPAKSAEGFVLSYFGIVLTVMIIYGIAVAAGLYADEYSKGTIKLVMLRPVGRNTLTTAKLLALFTHIVAILGATTLIAYIYGAIAFENISLKTVYVVFNSKSVMRSTEGAMVLCSLFFQTVKVLSYSTLAYMLGTVLRKKTGAIVISLVVSFGIIAGIFQMFGGERFVFSTNTDLSMYFGIMQDMFNGGNFFIALTFYVLYMAAIVFALYFTVKKRDIV